MPEPTPDPLKARKPRGLINASYAKGLDKTEAVIGAARDPLYSAQILDGGIAQSFITDLATDTGRARDFLAGAVTGRGTRKDATLDEGAERLAFERAAQGIQTRALQKYHESDPNRPRDTYYVGTKLSDASDAVLIQAGDSILLALQTDVLPGVDAARIAALQTAFTDWRGSISTQDTVGGGALTNFAQFKTLYASTEARRRTLQYAADDDFPYYEPVNKAAREAFKIPTKTPFRGE